MNGMVKILTPLDVAPGSAAYAGTASIVSPAPAPAWITPCAAGPRICGDNLAATDPTVAGATGRTFVPGEAIPSPAMRGPQGYRRPDRSRMVTETGVTERFAIISVVKEKITIRLSLLAVVWVVCMPFAAIAQSGEGELVPNESAIGQMASVISRHQAKFPRGKRRRVCFRPNYTKRRRTGHCRISTGNFCVARG